MESTTGILMEGSGEWRSFNGGNCVNEEADFMAKMFPSHSSLEKSSSSFYWSNNESNTNTTIADTTDTVGNENNASFHPTGSESNLYSSLSTDTDTINYECNEIYFMSDPDHEISGVDNNNNNNGCSSLPVGFWVDAKGCVQVFPGNTIEGNDSSSRLSVETNCDSCLDDSSETKPEMPQIESTTGVDNKSSDASQLRNKRIRNTEVEKGMKRNVRSKRSRKICLDDDDDDDEEKNNPSSGLDMQKPNDECIYEDNPEELSGAPTPTPTPTPSAANNVKTRANRGSAVDPQSLYARKRRERINERLRILQRLVPNGTKVDISTMLEEAVHYVKFLELQIELLSSDELWMYAPLAYNGMDIGLDSKLNSLLLHHA